MSKNFTLLLALILTVSAANAQITLNEDDMPKKYQTYYTAYVNTDSVGSANFDATVGAQNASWDLSTLKFTIDDIDTMAFVSPSSTKYKDSFPDANVAALQAGGVIMMKSDATGLQWLGAAFDEGGQTQLMKFDDPLQNISLPLNSTSKFSDEGYFAFKFTQGTPPFAIEVSIKNSQKREYEVTGYGSLKMNDNKDYEVLRLKVVEVDETESTVKSPLGTETSNDTSYSYYYEFWAKGFGMPMARVEVDSTNHNSSLSVEMLDMNNTNTSLASVDEKESFSIYPNPASSFLNVNYGENGNHIVMLDLASKQVLVGASHAAQVNLADLQKGMYVVQMIAKNGALLSTQKLMVN